MGAYLSRSNSEIEEIGTSPEVSYTYPPKSGSYFGSHFFMGGKKFDTMQPEGYLFGDNSDLNFLGPHPRNFTYQSPTSDQPVRALKCLTNIRKDSLRLIRVPNPPVKPEDVITNLNEAENSPPESLLYNLEFTFDADSPCTIAVYYNAAEKMCDKTVLFTPKNADECSDTVQYNAGCNQQFCLPNHVINPASLCQKEPESWNPSNIPIAIQVSAECGPNFAGHSHISYAVFHKNSDGTWGIKVTKQKQAINGVCYLFQEIYGIENKKKSTREADGDTGVSDSGLDDEDNSECVVCLSDNRDTIILPCKHLCLCSTCANQLRFQQSGCPICRQSFRALLQIRAVRKRSALSQPAVQQSAHDENADQHSMSTTASGEIATGDTTSPQEVSVPPGYEVIPLINAINGPVTSVSLASLDVDNDTLPTSTISNVSPATSLRHSSRKKKNKVNIENEVTSSLDDSSCGNEGKKSRGRRKKKSISNTEQTSDVTLDQQETSTDNVTESDDSPTSTSNDDRVVVDLQSTTADEVSPRPVTPTTMTSPADEEFHKEATIDAEEDNVLVHPTESGRESPDPSRSELA